jgi:HAD superfamily hydrolase (TIGR01509 family)
LTDSNFSHVRAVTFDFGQTLAELDHEFLAARLHGLGAAFDASAAHGGTVAAWQAYGDAKALGHAKAWQAMMRVFLRAGALRPLAGQTPPGFVESIGQALWDAQPTHNLWRKPIPGMFELAHELAQRAVPIAIISNSEGRLSELVREMGFGSLFQIVVDSGRLGIDKPDPRIFRHAAERLQVPLGEIVHVGDAWQADVLGAREAGAMAIWFAPVDERELPPGVLACHDAGELRRAFSQLGLMDSAPGDTHGKP